MRAKNYIFLRRQFQFQSSYLTTVKGIFNECVVMPKHYNVWIIYLFIGLKHQYYTYWTLYESTTKLHILGEKHIKIKLVDNYSWNRKVFILITCIAVKWRRDVLTVLQITFTQFYRLYTCVLCWGGKGEEKRGGGAGYNFQFWCLVYIRALNIPSFKM